MKVMVYDFNQVSDCILFYYFKKNTVFEKTHKLQNVTFETSETFRITNIQVQFIPFHHSRREERSFKIVMFYFETK